MKLIYVQLIGCIITVICSITFGIWLKRYPSKPKAVTITLIIHLLSVCAYLIPLFAVLFDENFNQYDLMLGLPILGFPTGLKIVGTIMLILGIFLVFTSILMLLYYGLGLPGIFLSERLAAKGLYNFTRNPMSLGFYILIISIALLRGSIFFFLWSLIVIIPTHICILKFFEERELELRFGQPFIEYKKRVPFLIPNLRNFFKPEKNSFDENFTQNDLTLGPPSSGFSTGLKIVGTIILILIILLVFTFVLMLLFYGGMGLPGIFVSEKLVASGMFCYFNLLMQALG